MPGGEQNSHPIQILVNYWELRPALMGARLDELIRRGISHLATFIPWQAVESDISHSLPRFLQVINEKKMTVSLILTPEVGVHYPNSGLPKDVISREENLARHGENGSVAIALPPNAFGLPSLFAPELTKRYNNFLNRMDGLLAEMEKNTPGLLKGVRITLTGSFWKYYRSPRSCAKRPFAGQAGDVSASASLAYRQRLDQYYAQREFSDPNPMAANRWKTRSLEEVNRRWFHQQSEDVFRARSYQLVRRKAGQVPAEEIELFTPEADPAMTYSTVLQMLSGGNGDFARLSQLVDEAASRGACASQGAAPSYLHWTSLGAFRSLADPEKQFLILKSLLVMAGQGGGILVDEDEWFALSQSFRSRVETFAKSLSTCDLKLRTQALYLAPHLWSGAGPLWDELLRRVGSGARLVSSLEFAAAASDARVLLVDPSFILTRETVRRLVAWARDGRVVALPRSPLYTEAARFELEAVAAQTKRIEIDLGVPYRLHALESGKLVIYDLPEALPAAAESGAAWQTFLTAILSVAEVQQHCRLSDSRLSVVPLERRDGGMGLFVLNASRRQVTADILFPSEVGVSDLALALAAAQHGVAGHGRSPRPAPANRFSLDVPPCGILPLAVDGIDFGEPANGRADQAGRAGAYSRACSDEAFRAAMSGLTGPPLEQPSQAIQQQSPGRGLWN